MTGEAREHAIEIMKLVFQLCAQYVNCHPANQLELSKKLDKMTDWFKHGLGAANVVSAWKLHFERN